MAVPEQTPYKEYDGNGVTKTFTLEFICESKDHLNVTIDGVEPEISAWSFNANTNSVTFSVAPAAGSKIVLQRNTPMSRTTNYQSTNNSMTPKALNADIDRVWLKLQELGLADVLLKLYVDRLHADQKTYIDNADEQLQTKISELRDYVDDQDDQLRAYLIEEIRKQGVALDQLEDYYNYLMQRLAQIAVDKGWEASFVVDESGKNQQEINDLSRYELKSIFWFMTPAELASFKLSAPRTFDFTAIINRALASFNAVVGSGTKQVLHLPAITGGYLITDTIWIPKHTGIIGDSGGLWQYTSSLTKPHSDIYADFSDPYKFVISSDTRAISTNTRIPYSQLIEGNTMDGGGYTWSDGITLSGFRIYTASRVFGGVKLIGSVKSFIDKSVVVTGCDYGYVTSACWDSTHNGSSLSYKCGYLGYDALNGTEVNGYHNNAGAPTLSTTNLLAFFEAGYKLPTTILNTYTTTFGVVLRKSFGVCGAKLIAESSDFPVLLYERCQASYNSVYAERVGQCAIVVGNQCQFDIGSAVGGLVNGAAIHLGTHAKIDIKNYYMIQDSNNHIYQTGDWGDTAIAKLPSRYFHNYHPQIIWNDKLDNVIYISSSGLDTNNGASYYHPTNINQAFIRISDEREKYDKTLKMPINLPRTIYCIDNGQYNLTQKGCILAGDIRIRRKPTLTTSGVVLNLNELSYLSNANLVFTNVTINIADKNYDFLSWARNAPIISQSGFNNLTFNSCVTNFLGSTQAVTSFDQNSDSVLNIDFKSGSIVGAGELVQRAETVTVGNIANVYVGSSCAVDVTIKSKANFGINLGREQQGLIVLPWRLRYASVTYDPPSLVAGLTQSTTVTLTGAVIGDPVACSFSLALNGTRMWAEVTSANTVTVYHRNDTGATVDVGSGILTVKLI